MRPRDLIEFFNNIVENAAGKAKLTQEMILTGEGVYSKNRMRSLQDEWLSDYPTLVDCAAILKKRPATFHLGAVPQEQVEDLCVDLCIADPGQTRTDLISVNSRAVIDGVVSWSAFLCSLMQVFYKTGIVGLKTESFEAYQWSHEGPSTISADTLTLDTSVTIHPTFHRVLGVRSSKSSVVGPP
jgi:hypothetical protein